MRERRDQARRRTRLRPAKLFGPDGRFLADAGILDLATGGARLAVLGNPDRIEGDVVVLDERERRCWHARAVWGRGRLAGLTFLAGPSPLDGRAMVRLAGRYYTLGATAF